MKKWRINLVFLIFIILGLAIGVRLFYLQVKNHQLYKALAQGQRGDFRPFQSQRGTIFFSAGQLLAVDIKQESENEISRNYPQGTMASSLIGFVGGEGAGQYGVEGYYDGELEGEEKSDGGEDIFLTVDYNVQFAAENLLIKASQNLKIEGGQIIVMDPKTGKILALADYPNFDPNSYFKAKDFSIFQNGSVQNLFEPGSTLKPITMAAAMDKGKITPETTFTDSGKVKIGESTIENFGGAVYGESTMIQVLEKSINTGVVFAEKKMGHDVFLNYLRAFGLFEPTNVDIQGEVYSENKQLENGGDINFATAAFGQGIEITPIQLARAFCAVANGGNLVKPYIVGKIVDNGEAAEIKPEISSQKVIASGTASKVAAMMVSVVENGFSKAAGIPGYYIAGKTGTSQISWSASGIKKRGYSDKTWQSFIGFFPAFNPRFLIFVKLDNPEANTAEYSAAPVFKELAQYLINYYSVPPDYEE